MLYNDSNTNTKINQIALEYNPFYYDQTEQSYPIEHTAFIWNIFEFKPNMKIWIDDRCA